MSPFETHSGLTGSLGIGGEIGSNPYHVETGAGLSADVGLWISPQLAVLAHVAAGAIVDRSVNTRVNVFTGADAQVWLTDNVWVGAGIGFGLDHDYFPTETTSSSPSGAVLDARIGLAVPFSYARRERPGPEHAISISTEVWGFELGPFLLATIGYHYL